jgi:hypothetical protein
MPVLYVLQEQQYVSSCGLSRFILTIIDTKCSRKNLTTEFIDNHIICDNQRYLLLSKSLKLATVYMV